MSGFTSTLEIATPRDPAEVRELLRTNLPFVTGMSEPDPQFPPTLFTTKEALQINVRGPVGPELIEETFGFRPTVTVVFELAKNMDDPLYEEGMGNELRGLDWIIRHLDGDLVFLVNRDAPALLRKDGEIRLDRKDRFWGEFELKQLTFPYDWKKIPEL
jgi:hypothetical protein